MRFNSLFESKQVGLLYHVCSLTDFCNYIIPKNVLQSSGNYVNKVTNTNNVISFTRDKYYMIKTLKNLSNTSKIFVQLCLDGDKLSNNYKVFPYNDYKDVGSKGEAEECIKGIVKNLKSYIKEIHFDFFSYELQNADYMLIKNAVDYFHDITYFNFNKSLKTKNPYELKTGDNITNLLKYIKTPTTLNKVVADYILYKSTKEDDGDRHIYSKEQNKSILEYLISVYNVDIKEMIWKGNPVAVLLLADIEGSKNPSSSIQMLEDLISLGMPYKKEYETQAKILFNKRKQNYDVTTMLRQILIEEDLESLKDFIKVYKQNVSSIVKNLTKTSVLTEYFDKDIFSYLCEEFPQQIVNLDVLKQGYKTKYYNLIKNILIEHGLITNKSMVDLLRFSNSIDDFDLSEIVLKTMKPDVLDDDIYFIIEQLYEKCFLYKEYDLLKLILSLGFSERLKYEVPYNQFIKLAKNNRKILSLLDTIS